MKHFYTSRFFSLFIFIVLLLASDVAFAAGNYFTVRNSNTSVRKFQLSVVGSPSATLLNLEYSADGGVTWTQWTNPRTWLNIPAGASYCFRGVNPLGFGSVDGSSYYYWDTYATVPFEVSGDIMSLVCGDGDRSTVPADYCFNRFFAQDAETRSQFQNTGLVFSASNLKKGCYRQMFQGCVNAAFITVPDLSAVSGTIPAYAMERMFQGCSKLNVAPAAMPNVTSVDVAACDSMFYGCSQLPAIVSMPALKTVAPHGCAYMYSMCAALTSVPTLQLDDVAEAGCYRMFYNCAKLASVADFSVKTVAPKGCAEMFASNIALTSVGNFKAQRLSKDACYRMFANHQTTTTVVYDVASVQIDQAEDSSCVELFGAKASGYGKVANVGPIRINRVGKYALQNAFMYQTRLQTIDTIQMGTIDSYGCRQMLNASGIQSVNLFQADCVKSYGCDNMFVGCTRLATIDSIKVPVVEDHGFYQMCKGRTTLTTLNAVQVDSLYDYAAYEMFSGCTGLTTNTPKQIPARYIGAYGASKMFFGCTKLENAAYMQPRHIGAHGCESMYASCSLLAFVPRMQVNYIGYAGCQQMFNNCPKIASPISLSMDTAANMACYQMFNNRVGGNVVCQVDTLQAKVLGDSCCMYMFGTTLAYAKVSSVKLLKADKVGKYACYRMFDQCGKLTNVDKISVNTIDEYGNSMMFVNCTTLTTLPDTLRAHYIGAAGCQQMFNTCAKINRLPVMLADTICRLGCYQMYYLCNNANLRAVSTMKADYVGDSACFQMLKGFTYLQYADTLRAKHLGVGACQEMFSGCTGLIQVNSIDLKNVAERGCYRSYYGCTNLTNVMNWHVDSIGTDGFKEMFSTCSNLSIIPAVLPAKYIGNGGCESMFAEDKRALLFAPKIMANSIGNRGCYQMFLNCAKLITPTDSIRSKTINQEGCMRMFQGCLALTTTPIIVADSVGISGCQEMFSGCTSLLQSPEIKFNVVNDYGCYMMFNGCTVLNTSPLTLPAKVVGDYGYAKMFYNCKALTKGSDILMEQVGRSGCEQMYEGCAALQTTTPSLLPLKASPRSYYNMYYGCTVLQNVPYIHAQTIADSACFQMCYNCSTAVTTQTQLPATTIGARGCYQMFYRCIKLNNVYQMNLKSIGSYGCSNMYRQCLALTSVPEMHCTTIGSYGCYLMFNTCSGLTSCGMLTSTSVGTSGCESMFTGCSKLATLAGVKTDKIGIRGCYQMFKNVPLTSVPVLEGRVIGNAGCQEMFSGCKALASLPSVLPALIINQYGCQKMFYGCTALTAAPEIAATSAASYSCQSMFDGCTALKKAGKLHITVMTPYCCNLMYANCSTLTTYADTIPSTIIGFHSCENMFQNDLQLTKAPVIAAKQIGSYGCSMMFNVCRALTTLPENMLSATQLASYCYTQMFKSCIALKHAPALPASVLPDYCYDNMFQSCTNLVGPPKMGATEMGQYSCRYMFNGCTSLDSVPELKALKMNRGCYTYMFSGCTKLTKVPVLPANQLAPYCYQYMFNGCTALQTTPTLNAVSLAPGCYYYMYNGCVAIDTTQDILPATHLADSCYMGMYYGCKMLRTAPTLPATNWQDKNGVVQKNCYRQMFYNCAKLTCMRVFLKEWQSSTSTGIYQTYNWVYGVSNKGDFYKPAVLDTIYNAHHIPFNTTYPWNLHEITLHTFSTNGGTWDGRDTISRQRSLPLGDELYAMKDGCLFTGWNTQPDGSGEQLDWKNPPTGERTYYAQYKVADIAVLDWENGVLVLQTTNTEATTAVTQVQGSSMPSVNNILSNCQMGVENPGLYSLSYDAASVHSHAGDFLNVTLVNATDTMGILIVKIPVVISTSSSTGTLVVRDSMDVWITNNSTYTIDQDLVVGNLYIQGGSKVVVTATHTLNTAGIYMRSGHMDATGAYTFCYPQLVVNGAIQNASDKINYEYLINNKQYYNLYLPYPINVGDITYLDGTRAQFTIEQYNGEVRKVGHTGWEIAWNSRTDQPPYPLLDSNRGYTISADPEAIRMEGASADTQRAYSYIRLPMLADLSNGELDSVRNLEVHGYGMTAGKLDAGIRPNDAGWNLVGNPYLADYRDVDGLVNTNGIGLLVLNGGEYEWQGTLRYLVMPSNDGKTYTPELASTAQLAAFKNFFVQIGTGDALNFLLSNRAQNIPSRMRSSALEDNMVGISIIGAGQKERVGLLLGDEYSEKYEMNADLDKWMNQGLNMYAEIGGFNLSMAAISEERATQPMALSITNAVAGEYTFAQEDAWTSGHLSTPLYLLDKQKGIYTDLTTEDYTCQLPEGSVKGRFFLMTTRSSVATDNNAIADDAPWVWSGINSLTIYQLAQNAIVDIYAASGNSVYHGSASNMLTVHLPQGIYTVRIAQDDKEYIRKSLVY